MQKGNRRALLIVIATAIATSSLVAITYVSDIRNNNGGSLPAGCTKPPNGFLVIAGDAPGNTGFNDSEGHGAPTNPWPIITVQKGTTVTITVCNTDRQAHSFDIGHYLDTNPETVAPGQVIHLQFVADQAGTFQIYCSIFCTIHVYMQNGELVVK